MLYSRSATIFLVLLIPLLSACPKSKDSSEEPPTSEPPQTRPATVEDTQSQQVSIPQPQLDTIALPQPDTALPKSPLETYEELIGLSFCPETTLISKMSSVGKYEISAVGMCDVPIGKIVEYYEKQLNRKAIVIQIPDGISYSFPPLPMTENKDRKIGVLIRPSPPNMKEITAKNIITMTLILRERE